MAYHGVKVEEKIKCGESEDCSCCNESDMLPDEENAIRFMCGECAEDDEQVESQELNDGLNTGGTSHPNQIEMWTGFQKQYVAQKKA